MYPRSSQTLTTIVFHLSYTKGHTILIGWSFVASWRFSTSCCDVVSVGEIPLQVSTPSRKKGDYTLMVKDTEANYKGEDYRIGIWNCESESIDQLND